MGTTWWPWQPGNRVSEIVDDGEHEIVSTTAAFNLPNQLTAMRLALSVVLFVLIVWKVYLAAFVVFLVAASTDWVDGYLARRYGLVTTLGRILDPFADKIIVCGSFIFLAAIPELQQYVQPWMVVVIVGRELLVTALRSFLEQQGADFWRPCRAS